MIPSIFLRSSGFSDVNLFSPASSHDLQEHLIIPKISRSSEFSVDPTILRHPRTFFSVVLRIFWRSSESFNESQNILTTCMIFWLFLSTFWYPPASLLKILRIILCFFNFLKISSIFSRLVGISDDSLGPSDVLHQLLTSSDSVNYPQDLLTFLSIFLRFSGSLSRSSDDFEHLFMTLRIF